MGIKTPLDSGKLAWLLKHSLALLNVCLVLGFTLGVGGLMFAGESFHDALYHVMLMCALNYSFDPPNVAADLARYFAAMFTIGTIGSMISGSLILIKKKMLARMDENFVVYGEKEDIESIISKNEKGIDGGNKFIRASNYILYGTEIDNLKFMNDFSTELEKEETKKVFLRTFSLPGMLLEGKIESFCVEELAARKFWLKYNPYKIALDEEGKQREIHIVLLGCSRLSDELLFYGMQCNAYAEVTYHLFGDEKEIKRFRILHANLKDHKVISYEEDWLEHLDIMKKADMILLADQKNQLKTIADLYYLSADFRLYIFSCIQNFDTEIRLFSHQRYGEIPDDHYVIFDWKAEGTDPERITEEKRLKLAQKANYGHTIKSFDQEIEVSEEEKKAWYDLDLFSRYAFLYHLDFYINIKQLKRCHGKLFTEEMAKEYFHRRRLYYYWFNNWTYDPLPNPENPAASNNTVKRSSRILLDRKDLSEEELEREDGLIRKLLFGDEEILS